MTVYFSPNVMLHSDIQPKRVNKGQVGNDLFVWWKISLSDEDAPIFSVYFYRRQG